MLKILKSGLWTSIQDQGRSGYRHFGVPLAGALDARSAKLANLLLNNTQDAAVLESTMVGPELEFSASTRIAITGADMSPLLNQQVCPMNKVIEIKAGDRLAFGKLKYGMRSYLAIKGGFQTSIEMGSRSFYANITESAKLKNGDELNYHEVSIINEHSHASVKMDKQYFENETLKVFPGPDFEQLNKQQKEKLLGGKFTVSPRNNRMAYQIDEVVENSLQAFLTSAVLPGTVQLTPSGKLIILMRDCQTTGGYPRVLQLSEQAINQLAQKRQRDKISFSNAATC